jgi:hypothetical protein
MPGPSVLLQFAKLSRVVPFWKQSRRPRVRTRRHQLAKADENRASCRENSVGGSGEVDLVNGGSDAVILDDPERARLSE